MKIFKLIPLILIFISLIFSCSGDSGTNLEQNDTVVLNIRKGPVIDYYTTNRFKAKLIVSIPYNPNVGTPAITPVTVIEQEFIGQISVFVSGKLAIVALESKVNPELLRAFSAATLNPEEMEIPVIIEETSVVTGETKQFRLKFD
jgi:hypothetical protein